ncbi:right-handed parallel beta-helix repeat-containing protein [Sphingomonas lacunae]|uniref:Right-handed parallel beta-helix repeat-containing protein n=1 Tax=Sphingomonas lacunae TaxID=2698828 RepID=A0A6M4AQD0_9SPHN|nr:right-handed parallel beta-helix repeat-containing protein [Sphingomonas lacunae]QJQ31223.1 right-handed parallel beta-helix repeat-containing protein [Sphingomonas lacunae]
MKRLLFTLAPATAVALSIAAIPVLAQDEAPGITVPELRETFSSVQDAVDAIGDGEGTILLAPGSYRQCAVQTQGVVHFRSTQPGQAVFDGVECEGKAALVLRGEGASVDGIVFQNMRVADRNGAGIRLERSNLSITNSYFRNSDQGILTAPDEGADVTIDRSTFSRLGRNDGGPSHSIYIGGYRSLTVTRSRFERGTGGHYIKTRAPMADIRDNTFDDTLGNESNYMIDLSAGSSGTIADNLFIQGENKQNYSAFIAVAPEAQDHSSAGLVISGNTARLAPGVERETVFVADWSGERLAIGRNVLGPGLTAFERR